MKKLFLLSAAAVMLFSACSKDDNTGEPEIVPEIQFQGVAGNQIVVSAEGGELTVDYTVLNPVTDGRISVSSASDWITATEAADKGEILLDVQVNAGIENRSSLVSIVYTYAGDSKKVEARLNVIQEGTGIVVDEEYTLSLFTGEYYGDDQTYNGSHNFFTILHDKPFTASGMDPEGVYFLLDLYAPAPEDAENPLPAPGVYTLGGEASTEPMTFSLNASGVIRNGKSTVEYFSAGTVTLSYENGSMTVDAVLTTLDGMVLRARYSGEAGYENYYTGGGPGGSVNMTATYARADYTGGTGDVMASRMSFYNSDNTIQLRADVYLPFDENGNVREGTYTIADPAGEAFTIAKGYFYEGKPYGTYIEAYESSSDYTADYFFAVEGTMEVSGNEDGGCTIRFDMKTASGSSMVCEYIGELVVKDVPKPFSTLTGDYTLDLSGVQSATAMYYGDYYQRGFSDWEVVLTPADGVAGDGLRLDVKVEGSYFDGGILTGTYTAADNSDNASAWNYIKGYANVYSWGDVDVYGTSYIGYDAQGEIVNMAPATSGDLKITNNGGDNYTISFSFQDDRGNIWDGQWSGALTVYNYAD